MTEGQRVYEKVVEISLGLPSSLKSVADFLLHEGSGIESLSMAELARVTFTSKPTLVRFAKHLGYSGWPAFRLAFLKAARENELSATHGMGVDVNFPFGSEDAPSDVARSIARVRALAAEHLEQRLTDELLERAATAIMGARRLVFFGRPPSLRHGQLFAYDLSQLGKHCWVPHAEDSQASAQQLEEGDCAIFSTYSGALMLEPFRYAQDARDRKATIIVITSDNSPLVRLADIALTFEPIERYYRKIACFFSSACISHVLAVLYGVCYQLDYNRYTSNRVRLIADQEGEGRLLVSDDLRHP